MLNLKIHERLTEKLRTTDTLLVKQALLKHLAASDPGLHDTVFGAPVLEKVLQALKELSPLWSDVEIKELHLCCEAGTSFYHTIRSHFRNKAKL